MAIYKKATSTLNKNATSRKVANAQAKALSTAIKNNGSKLTNARATKNNASAGKTSPNLAKYNAPTSKRNTGTLKNTGKTSGASLSSAKASLTSARKTSGARATKPTATTGRTTPNNKAYSTLKNKKVY